MALFFLFFFLFAGLVFQLWRIQISHGPKLAFQALEQRTQRIDLTFPRAGIYDCHLKPLTEREVIKSLVLFPQLIEDKRSLAHFLSPLVNLAEKDILAKLNNSVYPFRLGYPLRSEIALYLKKINLPGVLVIEERKRYEDRPLAAHLIGYINTIDNKGVSGLELSLDSFLKNKEGETISISTDAHKNIMLGLGIKRQKPPPELAANKVVLTIDYSWQKIVEEVMDLEIKKGAIVVMDPYTGDILAMASRPNFNPNRVATFFNQGNAALLNRAVTGYPPGSIFKIITASAALEEKRAQLNDKFYCPGYIMVKDVRINCHEKKGHGVLDLLQGFAQSCNPAFVTVGDRVGGKKLLEYSRKFGLGQTTGIGLPEERKGTLPLSQNLYPGDIANLSIGQGFLEVTPLQAAVMLSTIVNDGKRVQPHLVKEILDGRGRVIKREGHKKEISVVSPGTAAQLRIMLEEVTKTGTGRGAYVPEIGSAGKTGSAEAGQVNKKNEETTHAWFVGYAPTKEKPRWVISIFVEEGKSGGGVAAPVFKEIIEKRLKNQKARKGN